MDMFMDKLSDKLTAQEIIRANTAADTEELNRLRNQIAEYNDCLTKLQRLIDDAAEKLRAVQTGNDELDVEGNIEKINVSLQQNTSELAERLEKLDKKLDAANTPVLEAVTGLDKKLAAANTPVLEAMTGLEKSLQEGLQQFDSKLGEQAGDQLTEKLSAMDENVHKECVKVYRNVQAVILAESEKQREAISNEANGIGKKVQTVLNVSAMALIFSLLGIILQMLVMLDILPF